MPRAIHIRFYEELNDFLPGSKRKIGFVHTFSGHPSIKDVIESLGIPHVEVDLILVNGHSVGFDYRPDEGDQISVYPVFESIDISGITRLRTKPLRKIRLILDVHLGKLARYLRLLGFDTVYETDLKDEEIVERASKEKRIVLTRDLQLLKHKKVSHGYWVRSQKPGEQLKEVIRRLDLSGKFKPFERCMECNNLIQEVNKEEIAGLLKPKTRQHFDKFYRCSGCQRIYWNGTHYQRMAEMLHTLTISLQTPYPKE